MAELWASFAVRRLGPQHKFGYGANLSGHKEGAVYHSAEGNLATMLRLLDSPNVQKSWNFSNPKRGPLLQHYDAQDHAWCSGMVANIKFVSCESEGQVGEALTRSQVDNLVDLTVWLAEVFHWPRLERWEQLWEHRELTRFGSAPTACPSGRIPWAIIIERAKEEMGQLEDLRNQLKWARAVVAAVVEQRDLLRLYVADLDRRRTKHLEIEGITEG